MQSRIKITAFLVISLFTCLQSKADESKAIICNVTVPFEKNVNSDEIRFLIKYLPIFYNTLHKDHIYFKSSDGSKISHKSIIKNKEHIINNVYHNYIVRKYDANTLELYSQASYVKILFFIKIPFATTFSINIDDKNKLVNSNLIVKFFSQKDYNSAIKGKYDKAICEHLKNEIHGGMRILATT